MNKLVKRYVLLVISLTLVIVIFNYSLVFAKKVDKVNTLVPKNENINFESLTIKDKLSSNYITTIFQDSRGYIWIGTDDGLNQYDGNYIVKYNYSNGLASTYVNTICEDGDGNIWVGTRGGLSIINSKTEEIRNIKCDNSEKGISHYNVTAIYKDSENIMWIGTENGLNKYDNENEIFIKYYDEYNGGVLTNSYITDIKEVKDEYIVIASKCGASIVDIKTGIVYKSKFEREQYDYIYSLEIDNNEDIWFATKNGIYKYDHEADILSNFNIDIDEEIYSDITYILCDYYNASIFVKEIKDKAVEITEYLDKPNEKIYKCPNCKSGNLVIRTNPNGSKFYGCSNFPYCSYTLHDLNALEKNMKCPYCNDYLVLRKGPHGMFYGCNSYPKCDYVKRIK